MRRSTAMVNQFVKNGTLSKFWLTEITGPPPEQIPNILVGRNRPTEISVIFELPLGLIMANIRGLHVSRHCSMPNEVMESFSLSFFISRARPTLNLPCISPQNSVTCNGEYRRPVIKAQPCHGVDGGIDGGYVEYRLNKWCNLFYAQTYRPTHRSR